MSTSSDTDGIQMPLVSQCQDRVVGTSVRACYPCCRGGPATGGV